MMELELNMKKLEKHDFAHFYQEYGPMVLRRCRFLLKDEEKALDAMQDTFIQIFENESKIKIFCSSLFYIAATRVCLNKIKAEQLRTGPNFEEIEQFLADDYSDHESKKIEAQAVIESIFEKLDDQIRLIAILHYIDGLSLDETAEQTKLSVSTVRRRLEELKGYARKIRGSV